VIQIILTGDEYENDICPLVKAFYPEEEIKVIRNSSDRNETEKESITITVEIVDSYLCVQGLKGQELLCKEEEEVFSAKQNNTGQTLIVTRDEQVARRKEIRNHLKRMIYRLLQTIIGKELPWGTLTGIRPTKMVLEKLEAGEEEADIRRFMSEEYYCSQKKTELSLMVAGRENRLLKDMDYRNGYSIYIGIPFCPSTCLYCSFTSYSIQKFGNMAEAYLEALFKEISYAAGILKNKKLTTVYIGGGTPTTLNEEQLERLLSHIDKHLKPSQTMEYTVEAGRPDSITEDKLKILKAHGVTRISINPQTMEQKTLDLVGRRHTVDEIRDAFALARKAGHDNINMDIIVGLPGERMKEVSYTLEEIRKLKPDSLTVHTLALKRASRLNTENVEYESADYKEASEMVDATALFAEEQGYGPYYLYRQKNMAGNLENIGYAKEGKEGLYNVLIMEEKQTILALGAGAQSKFVFHEENRIERVENVKSLVDYIARIDEMIERKNIFLNENGHLL
jgi:oxygen-independent coproporphyrinogen-3 oxidase